jgi:lysozyme
MDVTEALAMVMRLCLLFEGLYLKPYLCPAGVPTIGVGSTRYLDGRIVKLSDPPISKEHALVLLRHKILAEYMPGVRKLCGAVNEPGRLAALTDLAYNIGLGNLRASTLRKRVLAGQWDQVPTELRKWVRGGGRVLPGLVRRREAECQLI